MQVLATTNYKNLHSFFYRHVFIHYPSILLIKIKK